MTKQVEKVLDDFARAVYNALGDRVKKLILYGSYARGDYTCDSDIDIMILTDLSDYEISKYRVLISDLAYDIEMENDVSLSPVLKNMDKFNYWLSAVPFYTNVQNEGVVLRG
ncbi:MAG: nucleotidyltransferase domain-containing protein [Oscillospiraceae bacterium]|nr:nucleotidyltransferase domain-containing protein [Oscillospiraceae bacterium]